MSDDAYGLFAHRLRHYVHGMTQAVSQRLESTLALAWWNLGVWPALSENQRESLRVGMERERRADQAD